MKADGLDRRLAALENTQEEPVPFSFQWFNDDGTPSGSLIRRMDPKSRIGWLCEAQS